MEEKKTAKEWVKQTFKIERELYLHNQMGDDFSYFDLIKILEQFEKQFQQQKKEVKPIEDRIHVFRKQCEEVIGNPVCFDQTTINFFDYWTEIGEGQKKMRFEKEKVFDIKKRLERWKRNNFGNNGNNKNNNGKPITNGTGKIGTDFSESL